MRMKGARNVSGGTMLWEGRKGECCRGRGGGSTGRVLGHRRSVQRRRQGVYGVGASDSLESPRVVDGAAPEVSALG